MQNFDKNHLKKVSGLVTYNVGESVIFYDGSRYFTISLNDIAFSIWSLCDGTRTKDMVVQDISYLYADEKERVEKDIRQVIDFFIENGMVELC